MAEEKEAQAPAASPAEPGPSPKPSRFGKRQILFFVAGFVAAAILIVGVVAAVDPSFLTGTFTKQAGSTALPEEVDQLPVACEPARLKAQVQAPGITPSRSRNAELHTPVAPRCGPPTSTGTGSPTASSATAASHAATNVGRNTRSSGG